jgi:hypothetical protein
VNVQLLIEELVRQTTVLIAHLSTAAGVRAPLSQIADQVFLELARELETQGVRQKVIADMFGLALRSYQTKVQRVTETLSNTDTSLWQEVYESLGKSARTRAELELEQRPATPKQVAAVVQDMVQSGLAYSSGRGPDTLFGLVPKEERERIDARQLQQTRRDMCWYFIARGSTTRDSLANHLRVELTELEPILKDLIEDGVVEDGAQGLRAQPLSIGLNSEQGWETAVLDHFRAVTTALGAKVSRPIARSDDATGGGTRSFIVHPSHPHFRAVRNLLQETRARSSEMWAAVNDYNARIAPPEDAERITFYFGQHSLLETSDEG